MAKVFNRVGDNICKVFSRETVLFGDTFWVIFCKVSNFYFIYFMGEVCLNSEIFSSYILIGELLFMDENKLALSAKNWLI